MKINKKVNTLRNYTIKSEVLVSDGWVSKFPKNGFERKVGQQITRWSCFPSTLEIANFMWHGEKGKRQEDLRDLNIEWQSVVGEKRWLMPHNPKTIRSALNAMETHVITVLKDEEITESALKTQKGKCWLLFFHRFSLPHVKPKGEVNHATVYLGKTKKGHEVAVPAYNSKYKKNKRNVFIYENWSKIKRRIPTYALLIEPDKVGKPLNIDKLKMWWL